MLATNAGPTGMVPTIENKGISCIETTYPGWRRADGHAGVASRQPPDARPQTGQGTGQKR